MEQTYRTETKVSRGGKVTLTGLPFVRGEEVEVVISRKRRVKRVMFIFLSYKGQ